MITNGNFSGKKGANLGHNFFCKKCDYICCKTYDWERHLSTRKHVNGNKMITYGNCAGKKGANMGQINSATLLKCICGNIYKFKSGLSRHKKSCSYNKPLYEEDNTISHLDAKDVITKEQLIHMLLSNQEIMKTVVDNMPKMGVNQANNTNSFNNQTFNIQMFLNENCKNAMNLTDFIDTLPITNETYDHTIANGLTKTISNMVVNGLNNLDITDRPIHCTDSNRKVLYVKEANKWEKDNELLLILEGIKTIALKQRTMINKWKDSNKGWEGNENLQNKLTNLVFNSMTDIENDDKETNKIIKAISKKVYLDNDVKKNYPCNI
jgi:hypothetical protein